MLGSSVKDADHSAFFFRPFRPSFCRSAMIMSSACHLYSIALLQIYIHLFVHVFLTFLPVHSKEQSFLRQVTLLWLRVVLVYRPQRHAPLFPSHGRDDVSTRRSALPATDGSERDALHALFVVP